MIDDDGTGTTGTVLNNAWLQTIYGQIDAADAALVGPWTPVPYNAADFTATGGTWAVATFNTFVYMRVGNMLTVAFQMSNSTIGGSPVSLDIKIPGGFTSAWHIGGTYSLFQGGGANSGYWAAINGNTVINLHRDILGSPFTAGANYVAGVFTFSIV